MITVTKINNTELLINAELIEFVEETPDTIITTSSGKKILVSESAQEIVKKVIEYRRLCFPEKKYKPLTDQEIDIYNRTDLYKNKDQ